ncbi:uncharacterized protein [Typha latifolia]|uniref:uncharacterized protein n=1 Tax=Typha latifolia TaxID=4733 RepID=UPI003C2C052D
MGICASCDALAVVALATAKVVLPNGDLREFGRPVRAGQVLEKDRASFFLCDADEMEFDGFVSAIGEEEELRLGQIYFLLPRTMLKRPIHADELAALAVKASAALATAARASRGRRGRRGAVAPLAFHAVGGEEEGVKKVVVEGRRRKAGGRGRKFTPELSAIPE